MMVNRHRQWLISWRVFQFQGRSSPHNIINLPKYHISINVHGWVEYANFRSKEYCIPSMGLANAFSSMMIVWVLFCRA